MKRQLVRASIVAIGAMRDVNPRLHFCHIDPVINVLPKRPGLAREASTYHLSQFEACDMILGRREPDLGGQENFVDLIGVSFISRSVDAWRRHDRKAARPASSHPPSRFRQ